MWAPRGIKRSEGIAYINSTNPSSEILGESAAALAAASVVFAQKDKEYSQKLLGHATDLYTRATTHLGSYMQSKHPNLQTVKEWYPSTIYTDELAWGAAWLYVATGDEKYRTESDGWVSKSADHLSEVCAVCRGRIHPPLSFLSSIRGTRSSLVSTCFCSCRPKTRPTRLAWRRTSKTFGRAVVSSKRPRDFHIRSAGAPSGMSLMIILKCLLANG